MPNDIYQKSDLDKVLEATKITNEIFKKRGYSSGNVKIVEYLMTGNLFCFTQHMSARDLASTIDSKKALLEAQTRLLRVSSEYAEKGAELVDNDIINLILAYIRNNLNNTDYNVNDMRVFLNNVLQRNPNSDLITNALLGKLEIKKIYEGPEIEDIVTKLDNYATLLDPNLEERVIFDPGNGRK